MSPWVRRCPPVMVGGVRGVVMWWWVVWSWQRVGRVLKGTKIKVGVNIFPAHSW